MLGAGALLNLLAAAEAAANNEQHGLGTHQIKCREPAVARCALYSAAALARLSRTLWQLYAHGACGLHWTFAFPTAIPGKGKSALQSSLSYHVRLHLRKANWLPLATAGAAVPVEWLATPRDGRDQCGQR